MIPFTLSLTVRLIYLIKHVNDVLSSVSTPCHLRIKSCWRPPSDSFWHFISVFISPDWMGQLNKSIRIPHCKTADLSIDGPGVEVLWRPREPHEAGVRGSEAVTLRGHWHPPASARPLHLPGVHGECLVMMGPSELHLEWEGNITVWSWGKIQLFNCRIILSPSRLYLGEHPLWWRNEDGWWEEKKTSCFNWGREWMAISEESWQLQCVAGRYNLQGVEECRHQRPLVGQFIISRLLTGQKGLKVEWRCSHG